MKRMAPDVRRQAIIDATLTVAIRNGLSATTVRDVAAEMGTSSGLIHHYFDSMDEVLAAAFRQVGDAGLEATRTQIATSGTPTDSLAVFFATYTTAESDWTFQLWLDAWSEAGRNPAIRSVSRELNIAWQQILRDIISAGIDAGEFVPVDVDVTAWKALSLLDGLALQVVAHRTVINRQEAIMWASHTTERDLGLDIGRLTTANAVPG